MLQEVVFSSLVLYVRPLATEKKEGGLDGGCSISKALVEQELISTPPRRVCTSLATHVCKHPSLPSACQAGEGWQEEGSIQTLPRLQPWVGWLDP